MTAPYRNLDFGISSDHCAAVSVDRVILWIGRAKLPPELKADILDFFGGHGAVTLVQMPLLQLDAATLARLAPCAVLSALRWSCCDVLDVARALRRMGYRGPYRALAMPLPDPDMIVAEVRASHPDVDFGLLEFGASDGCIRP